MTLSRLFFVHSSITLLAALVLIVKPEVIPATINISITEPQFLICYLLAAAELAISLLSFGAAYLKDIKALRLISLCFIAFHLCTATVELAVLSDQASSKILINVMLRLSVSALFFYYGRYKLKVSAT
ncbi:hypothetical protein CNR22_00610 [Sphingobacteriaceae bacterium]|nr:hypothetical protein CNR22_00610 [Sphingobacteriaceae bacterium]